MNTMKKLTYFDNRFIACVDKILIKNVLNFTYFCDSELSTIFMNFIIIQYFYKYEYMVMVQ
jgi:hypothetical protein